MTAKDKFETKVKDYLNSVDYKYRQNSIRYIGLKNDAKLLDGSTKAMHIVSFQIESSTNYEDSTIHTIWIDAKSERLEMLLTPHTFETINE